MVNYQNGKVYMIWYEGEEKRYYGSTTVSLTERLSQHKRSYKAKNGSCSVYKLFDKYGTELAKIELVEAFPCDNRNELEAREGLHIRDNTHINRCIMGRPKGECVREWKEANKERVQDAGKTYYQANKDKIKEYQQANKEKMKEQRKLRDTANKDKLRAYDKAYYEAHKKEIQAQRLKKGQSE